MPRTIRKRQLRNKKSRKQRGGNYTDAQKREIEKIQEKINASIKELLTALGNPEPQKPSVFNFSGNSKVSPENNENNDNNNNTSASVNNNTTLDKKNNNGENVEIPTNNNELDKTVEYKETKKREHTNQQPVSGNTVIGV